MINGVYYDSLAGKTCTVLTGKNKDKIFNSVFEIRSSPTVRKLILSQRQLSVFQISYWLLLWLLYQLNKKVHSAFITCTQSIMIMVVIFIIRVLGHYFYLFKRKMCMCHFAKGSEYYMNVILASTVTRLTFVSLPFFSSHNFTLMHLVTLNHFTWENNPFFPLQPFLENTSMNIMAATSLLGGENGLD